MIAAAALCMSASAMAEWVVVEQTESGAVMQENALGVSFAVQQLLLNMLRKTTALLQLLVQ